MTSMLLAHAEQIITKVSQSELPVVGTPLTAFVAAIMAMFGVFLFYHLIEHLPRPKKNRITLQKEMVYVKAMISFVVLAMTAGAWDVWWHRAIGRDTLWEAPHIFLYSFAILGIITGLYVWLHTREKIWKRIALFILIVPLTAPFDNFWHTLFGVEDLTRPISLSWAPPHAALSLSALVTLILLLKVLTKNRKTPDFGFFGSMTFGSILGIILFLIMPFHPTEGWGAVAGFAGAGAFGAALVGVMLWCQKVMQGRIDATFMMLFTILFFAVSYDKYIAPQIQVLPHDRPPFWLNIFAFMLSAIFMDISRGRLAGITRGFIAGGIWSGLLLGFATRFFVPELQYGWMEISIAVLSGSVGGAAVGAIFDHYSKKEQVNK